MARAFRVIIISLALLSLGLTAYGAEKVRFSINIMTNPYYTLPAIAALERGFWKEAGLEIEYLPFESGTTMQTAMAAGAVDVGLQGLGVVIQAIVSGLPIIIVADPQMITQFYFWVRADSPIKEPKDLKGGKIGVTRYGADAHQFALAVVRALGIERDVKLVSMGAVPTQVAGIKGGAIEAVILSNLTMAPLKAMGVARELLDIYDYLPKGVGSYQYLVVRKDFLEKRAELTKKGIQGYLKGADFVMKNKDWAVEKMKSEFKYAEETALAVYPTFQYGVSGKLDKSRMEATRNFLIQYGIVPKEKAPPLEEIYTTKLVE